MFQFQDGIEISEVDTGGVFLKTGLAQSVYCCLEQCAWIVFMVVDELTSFLVFFRALRKEKVYSDTFLYVPFTRINFVGKILVYDF